MAEVLGDDDLTLTAEGEGKEVQIDVKKEIGKITEGFNNVKDAFAKMKDADVKMNEWSFTLSYSDGEYIIDFKMKMSVKPKEM